MLPFYDKCNLCKCSCAAAAAAPCASASVAAAAVTEEELSSSCHCRSSRGCVVIWCRLVYIDSHMLKRSLARQAQPSTGMMLRKVKDMEPHFHPADVEHLLVLIP